MKPCCPRCSRSFEAEELNVARDLAICGACHDVFRLSTLIEDSAAIGFDLGCAPRGAWFRRTPSGWLLGATTRSASALFIVPFMTVWSCGSLGGIFGPQVIHHHFSLLQSLFGLPFLLGSLLFWSTALMLSAGKLTIELSGDQAEFFVGVGPIGWRRCLYWSDIRRVEEEEAMVLGISSSGRAIRLGGRDSISFGSGLSPIRRTFVIGALKRLIAERRDRAPVEPGRLALADDAATGGELSRPDESGALSTPDVRES